MFKNIINNVKDKVNTIKKENEEYKKALKNSYKFTDLKPLIETNTNINEKNINFITQNAPDINNDKAKIICKLIPINESFLSVAYIKEILTNTEYYLVPTDKYLWQISNYNYKIYNYKDISIFTIIKNNLMSKIINFNNTIIEMSGNNESINNFINTITNESYRNQLIINKTKYLCGIIPIYQKINNINSGISIDKENNIVFHTNEYNYKISSKLITNIEILLDNNPVISMIKTTNMTSMQNTCYSINIRITINEKQFIMPILEQRSFGTQYNYQDSTYQENLNFAKEIYTKIEQLCKESNN